MTRAVFALLSLLPITCTDSSSDPSDATMFVIGHASSGAPIIAYRRGTPGGTPVLAASGVHGDEVGGLLVTEALLDADVPEGIELWVIVVANPDGVADLRRQNDRGVDLNRNFDDGTWRRQGAGTERWSGPTAASEPETVALQDFIGEVRPVLSVWWHQYGRMVSNGGHPANRDLLSIYSFWSGWPLARADCAPSPCRGTATAWTHAHVPGSTAFVVELPRHFDAEAAAHHAQAFLWTAIAAQRLDEGHQAEAEGHRRGHDGGHQ
jgi:hypothetical protein